MSSTPMSPEMAATWIDRATGASTTPSRRSVTKRDTTLPMFRCQSEVTEKWPLSTTTRMSTRSVGGVGAWASAEASVGARLPAQPHARAASASSDA